MASSNDLSESDTNILTGARTALRPIRPEHYETIYNIEHSAQNIVTYRRRGVTVAPELFASTIWENVLAQYLIVSKRDDKILGVVTAFAYDARNGHVHLACAFDPQAARHPWRVEGVAVFIEYLFKAFPLRKIYTETLEFNRRQFESAFGAVFTVEGILLGHEYYDDRYHDLTISALSRERWSELKGEFDHPLGNPGARFAPATGASAEDTSCQ